VGPAAISAFALYDWLLSIGVDPRKPAWSLPSVVQIRTKSWPAGILPIRSGRGGILSSMEGRKNQGLSGSGNQRSPYMPDVSAAQEQGIKLHNIIKWSAPDHAQRDAGIHHSQMGKDPGGNGAGPGIQGEGRKPSGARCLSRCQGDRGSLPWRRSNIIRILLPRLESASKDKRAYSLNQGSRKSLVKWEGAGLNAVFNEKNVCRKDRRGNLYPYGRLSLTESLRLRTCASVNAVGDDTFPLILGVVLLVLGILKTL